MKRLILIAMLAALTGCGPADTPLTHGLKALKAGDHNDFLAAKAEAEALTKTAIQPGDDLCKLTIDDVEKYGIATALDHLDQPEIFAMPEEARFLYALKWAGNEMAIPGDGFLSNAPIVQVTRDGGIKNPCAGKGNPVITMMASHDYRASAEDARRIFLHDWMGDLKTSHGGNYDEAMRDHARHLSMTGYTVPYPPKFDFTEP